MPHITLYLANGACSLAAHTLLAEFAIPHKVVLMTMTDLAWASTDGTHTAEDYRKIHPAGQIPALKVDDTIITENAAILRYIGAQDPSGKALGTNDVESAQVAEWLAWLSGTLHGYGYGMLLRPARFTDDKSLYGDVEKKGREYIEKCYTTINQRLGEKDFPVGKAETVVDYYMMVFWIWGNWHDWDMKAQFPHYTGLVQRLAKKQSVRDILEQEKTSLPL